MPTITLRRLVVSMERADAVADATLPALDKPFSDRFRVRDAFAFLESLPVEQFWVAALDARHQPIGAYLVSQGTVSSSLVHPREVFAPALTMATVAGIVVVHNHPSGNPTPSREDIAVTERLLGCAALLGIDLVDHCVIASDGRVDSLRDYMPWTPPRAL